MWAVCMRCVKDVSRVYWLVNIIIEFNFDKYKFMQNDLFFVW